MKRATDNILGFLLLLMLAMMLLGIVSSCTSQKHIVTENRDSTVIRDLQDSVRVLVIERNKLIDEVAELQYGVVRFDTVLIKGDTVVNTVIITKEGEIKATGRIKEAVISKSTFTRLIQEKEKVIDSLRNIKAKETIRTVTEYKDRKVKRSVFNIWWVLIVAIIALVAGIYIGVKHKKLFV